jgi:hypothetical protein
VNENGCKDGYFCRAAIIDEWATNATAVEESENILWCEQEGDIEDEEEAVNLFDVSDNDEDVDCGKRNKTENLLAGSHPKECDDSSD